MLLKITSDEVSFEIREEMTGEIKLEKIFNLTSDIDFLILLKNIGTSKIKEPKAVLKIYNLFGAEITEIVLSAGTEEEVLFSNKLPEKVRKLSKDEEQELNVSFNKFSFFALYTAKLYGSNGDGMALFDEVSFYAGPLWTLIVFGLIGLIILYIISSFIRNYFKLRRNLKGDNKPKQSSKKSLDEDESRAALLAEKMVEKMAKKMAIEMAKKMNKEKSNNMSKKSTETDFNKKSEPVKGRDFEDEEGNFSE